MGDVRPLGRMFTGTNTAFPVELLIAIVENELHHEDSELCQKALQLISSDKRTPAGTLKKYLAGKPEGITWDVLRGQLLHTFGQKSAWTVDQALDLLISLKKDPGETIKQFSFRVKWVIYSVLDSVVDSVTESVVAKLWCQYSFLMGMSQEERTYALDNWKNFLEEEFLCSEIKAEVNEEGGCDGDEVLSTVSGKTCTVVISNMEKAVAEDASRTEYQGKIGEGKMDLLEVKEEFLHIPLENGDLAGGVKEEETVNSDDPDYEIGDDLIEDKPLKSASITVAVTKSHKKSRCGDCEGCHKQEDCGKCSACQDMIKHDGKGCKKKGCLERKCKIRKKEEKKDYKERREAFLKLGLFSQLRPGVYICIACGKRCKNVYRCGEHLKRQGPHHNNKCPKCSGVEFKSWTENQQHQNEVHNGVHLFRCKQCPEIFESYYQRRDHFFEKHSEDSSKQGRYTRVIMRTSDFLKDSVVSTSEDGLHICIACGKEFKDLRQFMGHARSSGIHHNNKCPKCPGVEFKSWPEHQQHTNLVHNGVFFLRCKYCPEFFETYRQRLYHVREVHEKMTEKVQCSECGIVLRNKTSLQQHLINLHSVREKCFPCKECEKKFDSQAKLNKHIKTCHDYTCCEICGKEIKSHAHKKKEHMLNHHTPEDKKPFVCLLCDPVKGFLQKRYYEDHMNIHNGLKPHVCELCPNVAYASQGNLLAHVRSTHHGKKRKPKK